MDYNNQNYEIDLPVGAIAFASIYSPNIKSQKFGLVIDAQYIPKNLIKHMRTNPPRPGAYDFSAISCTSNNRIEVKSYNIKTGKLDLKLLKAKYLECEVRNVSYDSILLNNPLRISVCPVDVEKYVNNKVVMFKILSLRGIKVFL